MELPLFMWWMDWGAWQALAVNVASMAGNVSVPTPAGAESVAVEMVVPPSEISTVT